MIAADEAPAPNLLAAALWYAKHGYAVFPVMPRGKVPMGALVPRGVLEATTDAAVIGKWWTGVPNANIGIAAGASQLVVIDVDPQHGGDESLAILRARYGADALETCTVLTGGGGTHLYYRLPTGSAIGPSQGSLGEGIDVRAAASYVVAPPSTHGTGNLYRWEEGYRPNEHLLLTLPDAIAKRLTETRPEFAEPVGEIFRAGERHAPLVSIAGTLRRRGLVADEIFAVLQVTNKKRCEPPLEDSWLRDIAKSMMKYQPGDPIRAMIAQEPEPTFERQEKPSGLDSIPVGNSYVMALSQPADLRRYPTGLPDLDKVLKLLRPGEMTVIGAQSGIGKSGLAEQIALEISKVFRVLFLPLEMGIVRTERRLLAKLMGTDEEYIERCEREDALEMHKADLYANVETLQSRKIDMLAPSTGDAYTYAQVRQFIVERKPDVVIIDHLQHLDDWSGDGKERSDLAAAKIVRNMRKLAELYGIHIMPIHQLKAGPQKKTIRPQLYDFADTAALVRVADTVIGLHRPMRGTKNDRIMELIVLKNRRGPEPWLHFNFVPENVTLHHMSAEQRLIVECCNPKTAATTRKRGSDGHSVAETQTRDSSGTSNGRQKLGRPGRSAEVRPANSSDGEPVAGEMTKAEEDALLNDLPFGPSA